MARTVIPLPKSARPVNIPLWDLVPVKTIISRVQHEVDDALRVVGSEMTRDLHKKLSRKHPPVSRPGFPPHRRKGFLRSNTKVTIDRQGVLSLTVPQYGVWLETGTENMKARPFIHPVIRAQYAKWRKRLNQVIWNNWERDWGVPEAEFTTFKRRRSWWHIVPF